MANPSLQTLLQATKECHDLLHAGSIPHVIIGGLAVYLHGHRRNSRDVDLLVRRDDWDRIRQVFESAHYVWNNFRKAYYSPTEVRVDFRFGGDDAGNGEVFLPDPVADQAHEAINDLPVLAMARLIETKLACALTGEREGKPYKKQRGEKHCADVAKLIAAKNLTGSYADDLHESVRAEFRRLANTTGMRTPA